MKDKIVFWGTDENEKDILVTLRLRAADNKVDIWTFAKDSVPDEFAEKMFKDWDDINTNEFPAEHQYIEHDLSEPSLLPQNIKAKNTEIVNRAEKEWYVKVLSSKLSQKLEEEIDQLAEQAKALTEYDKDLWASAKSYWDKVTQHLQDRDLTREHTATLRDKINACFESLKSLRGISNETFEADSKANLEKYTTQLTSLDERVALGKNLNSIFDELKQMQEELKEATLTREGRKTLRDRLNEAFENIRNQRKDSRSRRLESRIKGLKAAIDRMEVSLTRDEEALTLEQSRIETTTGKLEAQLRDAKIQMVQARLDSKKDKLKDMKTTYTDLEERLKSGDFTGFDESKLDEIMGGSNYNNDNRPNYNRNNNSNNNASQNTSSGNTLGDLLGAKLSQLKTDSE